MANLLNKIKRMNGVNLPSNYILQTAIMLDGDTNSDILKMETHEIMNIPADQAVVGIKFVSLETATSGGGATIQFALNCNGQGNENLGSALSLANLSAGKEGNIVVNNVKSYVPFVPGSDESAFYKDKFNVLKMTVGTAALTKVKMLVIVDTIPVSMFVLKG